MAETVHTGWFGRRIAELAYKRIMQSAIAFALISGNAPFKVGLHEAAALPDANSIAMVAQGPSRSPLPSNVVVAPPTPDVA